MTTPEAAIRGAAAEAGAPPHWHACPQRGAAATLVPPAACRCLLFLQQCGLAPARLQQACGDSAVADCRAANPSGTASSSSERHNTSAANDRRHSVLFPRMFSGDSALQLIRTAEECSRMAKGGSLSRSLAVGGVQLLADAARAGRRPRHSRHCRVPAPSRLLPPRWQPSLLEALACSAAGARRSPRRAPACFRRSLPAVSLLDARAGFHPAGWSCASAGLLRLTCRRPSGCRNLRTGRGPVSSAGLSQCA